MTRREPGEAGGAVDLVDGLVRRAVAAGATDVHFEPADDGVHVRIRVDAVLHDIEQLPAVVGPNLAARLKVLAGLLTYRTDVPQEGSIPAGARGFGCDIRVATFPTIRGERVVLRLMAQAGRLMTLADLGHDPALVERLARSLSAPQGMLVVCGPAGSGKTTTLYAMLAHLRAARPGASVIAVEDPVEIRLDGVTQVQLEPARGLTYPVALRSLLRQDPQILMIGEIRDAQTAQIAIEAALTGHLLLTTMHSGSPADAIVRLREMGVPAYQLTSTLAGVLAQRLVRTVCRQCGNDSQRRADCQACLGAGLAGRGALGWLVEISDELRQAVLAEKDAPDLGRLAGLFGSLHADARRLIDAGRTTADEVRRVLGEAD